jgi:D-glycero-D-manno-heptose 1,7-bisphosphate phosphatase
MRAVFLDRDGVISENRADHVKSWEEFCFIPGALTALRWLHEAGLQTFIVTNQAIINRGIIASEVLEDIHSRMALRVVESGGFIDDIRYCPHDQHDNCQCRKPRPGMLSALAAKWNIDLSQSYIVGDAWTDIAAGRAAHCRTIMVCTGRGTEHMQLCETYQNPADHIAADLLDAVNWIFDQEGIAAAYQERKGLSTRLTNAAWQAALSVAG